jgi:hypothetical protein
MFIVKRLLRQSFFFATPGPFSLSVCTMAQILLYCKCMVKSILLATLFLFVSISKAQYFEEGITILGRDTIHTPDIIKGDTVEAVFYIANLGTKAFWIYQVYAACQCTSPEYANDTFLPGRQDSVVLFFHSKNTTEAQFEKYALVLTPLGEKSFNIKGNMYTPKEGEQTRPTRKIRITNNPNKK